MTDRELMQQALDALEDACGGRCNAENNPCWQRDVANALRERLAQPEQEPVAWMHVMDNTEGLKANGTGIVSITQKRKHPFGKPGVDFSRSYPVTSTPLYAAPPQRKPLTDEEIVKITSDPCLYIRGGDYRIDIARAIEAAHGIKEQS